MTVLHAAINTAILFYKQIGRAESLDTNTLSLDTTLTKTDKVKVFEKLGIKITEVGFSNTGNGVVGNTA